MRAFVSIIVLGLGGCCFSELSQGVTDGMNLQTECETLIQASNASASRIEAMPEPLAGIEAPTSEQIASSFDPMALAYEQASSELAAIQVTSEQLVPQRDALAALYRESASTLRSQGQALAAAMQTGDEAAMMQAESMSDSLVSREDTILADLNRICARE